MPGWTVSTLIHAPQQVVWEQLTDFSAYTHWNPFMLEAQADFVTGGSILFLENLQEFGQHWITAQFLAIDPPQDFAWQGYFWSPFLFTVRHSFTVEAVSDRTTQFTQRHQNFGLLIPFLALRGVYRASHNGYVAFNQALKERCEMIAS